MTKVVAEAVAARANMANIIKEMDAAHKLLEHICVWAIVRQAAT
jgi:hypothetical protein